MLKLKELNVSPEVAKGALAVGAGLAAIAAWRMVKKARIKRAKWKKIMDVRQTDCAFRNQLKAKLAKDADNHKRIRDLPFEDLVKQLKNGQITAVEALHAYQYGALVAAEKTNCVATFVYDAEERARKLDELPSDQPKKPLHGVPVSLKETFILKGTEATAGIGSLLGKFKNTETGPLVQFLIDQGAVPFCKSNIPQAILSFDSRNPIYGITTHPTHPERSPGGSSSGEGVLLALKASVLGIGTDIGGSTRIPPAWCGATSLKPTTQRMLSDRGGAEPGSEGTNRVMPPDFGTYSFMARDVETLSTLYRLFYSDSTFAKNPELVPVKFRDEIFNSNKPLTIGYYYTLPDTIDPVPAMQRGVKMAKGALEKAGHKLVEFHPPKPRRAILIGLEAFVADGGLDTGMALAEDVEISYPNQHLVAAEWPNWFRNLFSWWFRDLLGSFGVEVLKAMVPVETPHAVNLTLRKIKAYRQEVLEAMQRAGVDALLGPAFACPACHIDDPREIFAAATYTLIYNNLNWPAGILPVTKVSEADEKAMETYPGDVDLAHRVIKQSLSSNSVGLPVAIQVAARPYCEEMVLRVMTEINSNLNS